MYTSEAVPILLEKIKLAEWSRRIQSTSTHRASFLFLIEWPEDYLLQLRGVASMVVLLMEESVKK